MNAEQHTEEVLHSSRGEVPTSKISSQTDDKIPVKSDGLISKIRAIIENEIRPTLQGDGGDIEFVDFEDNIVKVKLYGACAHCPSSLMHMHGDVEELLKEKVPEIEGLELVS